MSNEHKSELEDLLKQRTPSKDEFFKEFLVSTHIQNKKKYLITTRMYNDPKIAEREAELKRKRKNMKDDFFVNLVDYTYEIKKNLCSTNYIVRSFYEFPQRSLKREIFNRRKNSKVSKFTMEEMTHLFYNILNAGKKLQEMGKPHGDISPFSIFHTNDGKFKLAPYPDEHMTPLKIQQEKSIKGEPMYVSSQMLFAAKKRKTKSDLDPYKSDIFSLGLVLLEAGLLKNVSNIYTGSTINETVLNQYVSDFEGQYCDNPLLFSSLQRMLELKEDDRADFVGLSSVIPPYAEICDYFYNLQHGLIDSNEGYDDMDPNMMGPEMGDQMGDQYGYHGQDQYNQQFDEYGNPIYYQDDHQMHPNNQGEFDPMNQWEGQEQMVNAPPPGQYPPYQDHGDPYNQGPNMGHPQDNFGKNQGPNMGHPQDQFGNQQFRQEGYDQNNYNDQYDPHQGGYDPQQGGYDPHQGGYDPQQGGYDPQQGGYDPHQGDYNQQYDPHHPNEPYNDNQGGYNNQYDHHNQYDQNQNFNQGDPQGQYNDPNPNNQRGPYQKNDPQNRGPYQNQHPQDPNNYDQGNQQNPNQFHKKMNANHQNQGYNQPPPQQEPQQTEEEEDDPYGQTNDEYDNFFNNQKAPPKPQVQSQPQHVQKNTPYTPPPKSEKSYSYGNSTTAPSNTFSNYTPSYTPSQTNYNPPANNAYSPPPTNYKPQTTTSYTPQTTNYTPQTTTSYTPQTTYKAPTPTTTYGQPKSTPTTSYQAPAPTTNYNAPSQGGGDIVVRNGKQYRQVKETRQEVVNGQMVTKVIIKLTPV